MAKGKTSFLSKLLIFLFGFLFAIILEVGVIVGGAIIVANMDIEQIFSICNVQNADQEGNQYVNTDVENGGYKTTMDLINGVMTMFANVQDMTVSDVEKAFPASGSLVNAVNDMLNPYVEIDVEELKTVKFLEFGDYLQELILSIEPARLLNGLEMGDLVESNVIIEAVLIGTEFSYVEHAGLKFPVYYTDYKKVDMGAAGHAYFTVNGDNPYPLTDESWILDLGEDKYRVYYYAVPAPNVDGEPTTAYFVTDENCTYFDPATPYALTIDEQDMVGTGYFYYDAEGERVQVKKITFETIMGDAFEPLTAVKATELLDPDGDDKIIQEAFAGITVADVLTGNISMDDIMAKMRLPAILDVYDDNAILKYLAYNVVDVVSYDTTQTISGHTYDQKGTFIDDLGTEHTCYLISDASTNLITEAFYMDGTEKIEIEGVAVVDVSSQIENITNALRINDVLGTVDPSNKIMAYMCYSLVNMQPVTGEDYAYTATHSYYTPADVHLYENCYVYVRTLNGQTVIDKVVSTATGEEILSVHLSEITDQVNHLTESVELGDIIHIDSSDTMLVKLQHSTIGSLPEDMKALTIQEIYCLDVYGKSTPELATTYNPYYIYYTFTESGYYKSAGKITEQKFATGTYYTYGAPKGIWTLLVCDFVDVGGVTHYDDKPCAVNEMYSLISRMQTNIDQATLLELKDFGVIEDEKGNLSTKYVPTEKKTVATEGEKVSGYKYAFDSTNNVYYTYEVKLLGECTVNEVVYLIDYIFSNDYAIWVATAS